MPFRSIVLELTPENEPRLLTLVEESWPMAQHVHDGLRATVQERGGTVIYSSLIDSERPLNSCCTNTMKPLA